MQSSKVPYQKQTSLIVNDTNDEQKEPINSKTNINEIPEDHKNDNKYCGFRIAIPSTGTLKQRKLTVFILAIVIDAIANVCLFFTTHDWWFLNGHSMSWFTWHDFHRDLSSFHHGTSDTIVLWLIRTICLIILGIIAIRKGVPIDLWNENDSVFCCCVFGHKKHKKENSEKYNDTNSKRKTTSYSIQKLLKSDQSNSNEPIKLLDSSNDVIVDNDKVENQNLVSNIKTINDESASQFVEIEGIDDRRQFLPKFEDDSAEEKYRKRKVNATRYKYGVLLFAFMLCTMFQGFVGVKCVGFRFAPKEKKEIIQVILFGISIICINIEIFLLKELVESATDFGESIIIKSLHPHPVVQKKKIKFWCDLCRARAKFCTYRCDDCNFDVCSACFKKEKKRLLHKQREKMKQDTTDQLKNNLSINAMSNAASESYAYLNARHKPENDPTLKAQKEMTSMRYMIRGMHLCKPHSKLITCAFICLAITTSATLLLPRTQGKILDKIIDHDRQEFIYQIKYYVILSVIMGLFGSIRNLCFRFVIRRLMVSIRSLMFGNIIVQDIVFFDDMSTGELISRMTNDVGGMLTPLRTMLQTTLSNTILLIGGLIMCFVTSWRLSMLAFTTVAPVLFLTGQYAKWSKNINRAIWAAFGASTAVASQAFSNIRTVRAFAAEKREIDNYDNAMKEILERGLANAIASTATFALTNYLDLAAGVLILYFGGMSLLSEHHANELTVGKLITFQLYWNMINNAYKGLQNVLTSFTRGAGAAQRVLSLLDVIGDDYDKDSLIDDHSFALDGNIVLDNVHFTYKSRPEAPVLKGINLQIHSGQIIALVGKSGGGKSTLLHLLMNFYKVSHGNIYYNKERLDLNEMNSYTLRKQIGFVAQDTQLFDCTIKDNIVYGMENEKDITLDEVIHFAKLANCHEFISKFEEGYMTRVGERGIRLSGGQKQRIAICRMLIKRPRLLFLDEATSNLDTESEALVQSAIDDTIWDNGNDENENDNPYGNYHACAVILVAHRLSTVINADKIAVVHEGKIVEFGNHQELLEIDNGVYRKLVQRQIQREQNVLDNDNDDGDDGDDDGDDNDKKGKKGKKKQKKTNVALDDIDSLFD